MRIAKNGNKLRVPSQVGSRSSSRVLFPQIFLDGNPGRFQRLPCLSREKKERKQQFYECSIIVISLFYPVQALYSHRSSDILEIEISDGAPMEAGSAVAGGISSTIATPPAQSNHGKHFVSLHFVLPFFLVHILLQEIIE